METQKLLFSLLCCFLFSVLSGQQVVHGRRHQDQHSNPRLVISRPKKLFVFGDSYADTGNKDSKAYSWKDPYGITFPGKPSGRSSDGRILTDYVAEAIGVNSPIPYKSRQLGAQYLKYGMNFAYGGTGVFNTLVSDPNMTTQIDFFQDLIKDNVFTAADLESSLGLVSLAGNDYSTYAIRNGSAEGWEALMISVIDQLTVNLKRIRGLGVKKIALTGSQPLGCLPRSTAKSSFQQCNESENSLSTAHNELLQQAVARLNNETKSNDFVILDLYASFKSAFKNNGDQRGGTKFKNPLKPCCIPVSSEYFCGSEDATGAKKYTICEDPKSAFFWDTVHPSQEGWRTVSLALQPTLRQL